MVDTKICINLLDGFPENDVYGRTNDGRMTDDACMMTVALLCSSTKLKNPKNIFFSKNAKTSGGMAQGKQQLKLERNPSNKFRDNRCHRQTDGRQTKDEFRFHELCLQSQQNARAQL